MNYTGRAPIRQPVAESSEHDISPSCLDRSHAGTRAKNQLSISLLAFRDPVRFLTPKSHGNRGMWLGAAAIVRRSNAECNPL